MIRKKRINKLFLGKCEDILTVFPSNSIDTIITDPPAGIAFMNKKWDSDKGGRDKWIEWFTGIMTECYRIIKPGGIALVWAIPRTSHWTATAIENAGFRINDIIMHIFGSGFPKSLNISKQIDKTGGKAVSWFGKWLREWRIKNNITQKEIAKLFPSKTGGLTGCVANWELGFNIPMPEQFTKICRKFNLPFKSIKEAEREIMGKGVDYGHQVEKNIDQKYGFKANYNITAPATPEAQQWDGYGTGLKPAAEHWIFAMKPCGGTYAQNALKWGVAGININGGRIGNTTETHSKSKKATEAQQIFKHYGEVKTEIKNYGRFPANIIFDEESAAVLDEQSGVLRQGNPNQQVNASSIYGSKSNRNNKTVFATTYAGASRFFYCAKASKSERSRNCENIFTLCSNVPQNDLDEIKLILDFVK